MQLDITTYGRSSSNLVFALVLTAYMNKHKSDNQWKSKSG